MAPEARSGMHAKQDKSTWVDRTIGQPKWFLRLDAEVRASFFDKMGRNKRLGLCRAPRSKGRGPKQSFECVVEASKRIIEVCLTPEAPRRFGVIGSSEQAHTVDALAVSGDEGRGSLRKASGSRQQTLIRGCPNGETHSARSIRT